MGNGYPDSIESQQNPLTDLQYKTPLCLNSKNQKNKNGTLSFCINVVSSFNIKPSKLPADALYLPYWGNQSSYNGLNNALNQENTYAEFCLSEMQHLIIFLSV